MAGEMNRAKAWCFDHEVTKKQIETAWNKALNEGVPVVKNLDQHGRKWWSLPSHLLEQLVQRYS